jgi:hypothetical protein
MPSTTPPTSRQPFLPSQPSPLGNNPRSRSTSARGRFPARAYQVGRVVRTSSRRSPLPPSPAFNSGLAPMSGPPFFSHPPPLPATFSSRSFPPMSMMSAPPLAGQPPPLERGTAGGLRPPPAGMYTSGAPSVGNITVNTVSLPSSPGLGTANPSNPSPLGPSWYGPPSFPSVPPAWGTSASGMPPHVGYVWVRVNSFFFFALLTDK